MSLFTNLIPIGHAVRVSAFCVMPLLSKETINPLVIQAEYAVRGELALKANELEAVKKPGVNAYFFFRD